MKQKKLFSHNSLLATITFLFGVMICQYTGNRGVFPIDSFSHFDSGYRILNGEHPFKDYWIVSGVFIDYLQSIIFYILGINWQTYLLNSSLLNGSVSLLVYFLFINLGLNFKLSFFYAICFSILAYPSSGTPFVDHHSALLSLIAIIMLIKAMKTNKLHSWFLVPVFMFFAFLSKQVPATYIFFAVIFMIVFHLTHQKKKDVIIKILQDKKYTIFDDDKEYKYLLKMSMDSVSEENVQKLLEEYETKAKELEIIKSKTIEKMWLEELLHLEKEYKKYFISK